VETKTPGAQPENDVKWPEVAGIAAAATAMLTTISGLAVTGALQRMQRDHGFALIASLSLAVSAATVWLAFAILKPALQNSKHWDGANIVGRLVATGLFVGGIIVGILGMIHTQADRPRPTVSATFDPRTLKVDATATVHNLDINGRLVTLIVGLKDEPGGTFEEQNRYVVISGPDQDGTVTQHVVYTLPKDVFSRVGVSTSTGDGDRCDYTLSRTTGTTTSAPAAPAEDKIRTPIESVIAQHDQPGCAVIALPPR
jgi:hypothetical protein